MEVSFKITFWINVKVFNKTETIVWRCISLIQGCISGLLVKVLPSNRKVAGSSPTMCRVFFAHELSSTLKMRFSSPHPLGCPGELVNISNLCYSSFPVSHINFGKNTCRKNNFRVSFIIGSTSLASQTPPLFEIGRRGRSLVSSFTRACARQQESVAPIRLQYS